MQLAPGGLGRLRDQDEGGYLHCLGGAGPVNHRVSDLDVPPPFPQCREVCGLNTSNRCDFVRSNPDCRSEGGYLDYLEGIFCHFPPDLLPLAVTLYVRPRSGELVRGAGGPGGT